MKLSKRITFIACRRNNTLECQGIIEYNHWYYKLDRHDQCCYILYEINLRRMTRHMKSLTYLCKYIYMNIFVLEMFLYLQIYLWQRYLYYIRLSICSKMIMTSLVRKKFYHQYNRNKNCVIVWMDEKKYESVSQTTDHLGTICVCGHI